EDLGASFATVQKEQYLLERKKRKSEREREKEWDKESKELITGHISLERSRAAHGNGDALSRRDALWCQTASPSRSELRERVCGRRPGEVRGEVIEGRYVLTCWLHPQTLYGGPEEMGHTEIPLTADHSEIKEGALPFIGCQVAYGKSVKR
ncbi:hypothetical protein AAFF_G00392260, partial [Aldrovandia affinis]